MGCLVKTTEYRTKLKQSGISEKIFYPMCGMFVNKYDRLPNLDELPGVDSSKFLADTIHMTDANSASIDDIMASTGASTIEEANVILNDTHSDLEIDITPLNKEALVDVKHRPSEYAPKQSEKVTIDPNPNMRVVLNQLADKLGSLYGIKINTINSKQLEKMTDIPSLGVVSAFIHQGNIYVNTDYAKADAPIHELTHLLLGSIRYKNPDLYFGLVQTAPQFNGFQRTASQYAGRAESDIMEEVFVEEVAKYLSGMPSAINGLPAKVQYELNYGIKRLMDSVLMGDFSVKAMDPKQLYNMSLTELARTTNSQLLTPTFFGSLDDAAQHRMLANVKEDLIKNGTLEERCE